MLVEDFNFHSEFNDKWSVLSKNILRFVSEDSRISLSSIARKAGSTRKIVSEKLSKLEKALNLKYTIELNESLLGFMTPHLILVRFTLKPDYNEIKKLLSSSYIPQLVVVTKGNYDLLIYANARNLSEYVYWEKTMQILLSKYGVHWQSSDFAFKHFGFFPLTTHILGQVNLPKIQKQILLLLNENSRLSLNKMSKKLKVKPNTLGYNLKKLVEGGYIKRFTTVIRSPPPVSFVALFGKYTISRGFEEDSMRMRQEITFMDDKMPLINRCIFSAQLIGSYDFFFVGVYDNIHVGEKQLIKYYQERFKRHDVKVLYGSLTKVLIGSLPLRSLDVMSEFDMIRWIPGGKPEITKYFLGTKAST